MWMLLSITFVLLGTAAQVSLSYDSSQSCRCLPSDPCWPSMQEWQALNNSIQGNLFSLRPVGAVCHDPTFDDQRCNEARSMSADSEWISQQPGALQWLNWEAWQVRNESCFIESSRYANCGQGRIPLYSAKVQSASQIQDTVRFAKKNNLRLVIRGSGHDILGRSSAPLSLQISTSNLKSMVFTDNFVPNGGKQCPKDGLGSAVTLEAGVPFKDLYAATKARGLIAVGGFSRTVNAAGGYIQGGGHSFLCPWKGMASDNALEFELVTADGDPVVANECQNTDLFWALRGGGGGTFGVVTRATIKTYPDPPMVLAAVNVSTTLNNRQGFLSAFSELQSQLPNLSDNGASGMYNIWTHMAIPGSGTVSLMTVALWFIDMTDTDAIGRLLDPLLSKLHSIQNVTISYELTPSPSAVHMLQEGLAGANDGTGKTIAGGSRLISRDFLLTPDGPSKVTKAFASFGYQPNLLFSGVIIGGGKQYLNGDSIDSALNPIWRKTLVHVTLVHTWPLSTSPEEQNVLQRKITNSETSAFRSLEPDMGAYMNEADNYEPDFQNSFWGSNYRKLYEIKQKWDPTGLFITRLGVGSEDWDEDGLCLINGYASAGASSK